MTSAQRLIRCLANYWQLNAQRSLASAPDSQFEIAKFGDTLAISDPSRAAHPFYNRVLGLAAADAGELKSILAHYKNRKCKPHFDLGADAIVPELISSLVERGFEPSEALHYLSTTPGSQAPKNRNPAIRVERWNTTRADEFRALLASSGVECDDAIWQQRRKHYCTDVFRVFVAHIDDSPRAWATLFADHDTRCGYLANAFTMPKSRDQSCHLALLEARLLDARELRLKAAYTDVIEDTVSVRNCRRAGMKPECVLTLWRN